MQAVDAILVFSLCFAIAPWYPPKKELIHSSGAPGFVTATHRHLQITWLWGLSEFMLAVPEFMLDCVYLHTFKS